MTIQEYINPMFKNIIDSGYARDMETYVAAIEKQKSEIKSLKSKIKSLIDRVSFWELAHLKRCEENVDMARNYSILKKKAAKLESVIIDMEDKNATRNA